jgi:hypothetical protein
LSETTWTKPCTVASNRGSNNWADVQGATAVTLGNVHPFFQLLNFIDCVDQFRNCSEMRALAECEAEILNAYPAHS